MIFIILYILKNISIPNQPSNFLQKIIKNNYPYAPLNIDYFFKKSGKRMYIFSNDQLGINTSKITYKHIINNIRLCLNHTRFIALIVLTPPYSHNLSIYCDKIHH